MTYQVLARKWRPQDFSSVVGQAPIVTALRNALTEDRIAQAYLFSGIRGVGKTSVARVLAKALNCERGPAADPCNECQSCTEITAGSSLDVLEIDAATHSKVEQTRELTESLKYGPAQSRYKVVVIDEIHRLSRQAFDALLKIVEEPPDHLVFIFATTEIEAVPATILSRCQEFHFRRVPSDELVAHLERLATAEEIEVGENALRLLARAGEGSVRDSVALLDQLATYGSGSIDDAEAARILGGVDVALFSRLLQAIVGGRSDEVSAVVHEIEQEGWDPRRVYTEFLSYCRDALRLGMGSDPGTVDLPAEEAVSLAAVARDAGYENLLRLLHQLLHSEQLVRRSEAGSLAVEIAWLKATELPKLTRIEELLGGGATPAGGGATGEATGTAGSSGGTGGESASESAPRATASDARPAAAAAPPEPEPSPTPGPAAPEPGPVPEMKAIQPVAEPEPEPAPEPPPAVAEGDPALAEFLVDISRHKPHLTAHLSEAERLHFADGRLTIYAARGDSWLANALERGSNRQVLESALATVWGEGTSWRLREGSGAAPTPAPEPAPESHETLKDDPVVQTVLDVFGGTIEEFEQTQPSKE